MRMNSIIVHINGIDLRVNECRVRKSGHGVYSLLGQNEPDLGFGDTSVIAALARKSLFGP